MADMEMAEYGSELGLTAEQAYEVATSLVPSLRPANPSEVAHAVTWLASANSTYVNGAALQPSGATGRGTRSPVSCGPGVVSRRPTT